MAGGAAAAGITAKQAMSMGSMGLSAIGSITQGISANRAAKANAAQLQMQADRDRQIAQQEAGDLRDREARLRASFRAKSGGTGRNLEGTPLTVLSDLASEAEFQALRVLAGGETEANRAENEARIARFEGKSAQTAGFFRAGASVLKGASKFERDRKPTTQSPGL